MPKLTDNNYGKSGVRLTKVVRKGKTHHLHEYEVSVLCSGDFSAAYLKGDNRKVIATDSIKNTVYVLAKENHFDTPEAFAILVAKHFVKLYTQLEWCNVSITQAKWDRIIVKGRPHAHSFVNGGAELHTAAASARRGDPPLVYGGISDLLVIKTTNSAWKDFWSDHYRTLKDTDDRIMATSITAQWLYKIAKTDFAACTRKLRTALLETFATHNSLGVQQTMYAMGEAALTAAPQIADIHLHLPNKHRIPFNLAPFGLKYENDIFVWTDEPYGEIQARIVRK